MDLISTSWTCQRCGSAFISTPPDSGLCPDCVRHAECSCPHPEAPLYMCPDAQAACSQCGGPVCARCGQRLILIVPVTGPAHAGPAGEVTGDDS